MMPGMGFSVGGVKRKGGATAGKIEKKVEKTIFDLNLEEGFSDGAKIKIIKEVRSFIDLGLKEAKDLVEKAPTYLKKGVTKEEAKKIIENIKGVGAKVTMEYFVESQKEEDESTYIEKLDRKGSEKLEELGFYLASSSKKIESKSIEKVNKGEDEEEEEEEAKKKAPNFAFSF
ncbi:50S ribosomal protein L7/L12 [Capsicum annuum]|uniref:Large ribosomal subunit protein bL12c n=1 Tax=Capsicum annuum TaxID=4072 RepID=A0A2G2YRD2_CAPAN|nr:50S ribosomal protein L7/L12 [Capsicum annuum]KAF3619349.1 50S ribosomal protein L7/L12 [Capsicum annuum]PHT72318.1 50S ribosomal protein L7/L12 [Capsicum annuum]